MNKISGLTGRLLITALLLSNFAVFKYVAAAPHSAGTNIISNGTIYMITDDGQRRPYTSAGAFLSYGFNSWAGVVEANADDLVLPVGSFIPPRDGKIVCSDRGADKGTCYLITNGKRAAFVSGKIFTELGFSFAKALTGDVSFLEKDNDITTSAEQHRSGVLINRNGTIYLVSPDGLMGIPSLEVLKSWGYTFEDSVKAVNADAVLSERSVIETRKGARLVPAAGSVKSGEVSDASLLQSYVDTHPDLPTKSITAPEDGAQVIDLIKKIKAADSPSFDPILSYLSSETIEMLKKSPNIKRYLESKNIHLFALSFSNSKVQVFEGGVFALYTETYRQAYDNYLIDYTWVCKKENGIWKWDYVGTMKYNWQKSKENFPDGVYTVGIGKNDIGILRAEYTENPEVENPETWLLVEISNRGVTTIKTFSLSVLINGTRIIDTELNYDLPQGQIIYLAIPIDMYWLVPGVTKEPGNYKTEIKVGFGASVEDHWLNDNSITIDTKFNSKYIPVVNNLVGSH